MKFALAVSFALIACAAAQYEDFFSANFPSGAADFSAESSFLSNGGSFDQYSAGRVRDPRGNTGPVVFPPSPPGDPSQTSGVVAGASGFGFVPPNSQGFHQFFYNGFYF